MLLARGLPGAPLAHASLLPPARSLHRAAMVCNAVGSDDDGKSRSQEKPPVVETVEAEEDFEDVEEELLRTYEDKTTRTGDATAYDFQAETKKLLDIVTHSL